MGIRLADLRDRVEVDLLEAPETELLWEDAEERLSRFVVPVALTQNDHVVDLESATMLLRVGCIGEVELVRAICYKVIVQYQFHMDRRSGGWWVFSRGATD